MGKSIKKNYIYNLCYQIFTLIIPLLVTPYVARVLGSYGVGQYAFTYSIVSYFILFAALGFGVYGQREIAKHQGNKKEQSLIFYEIFLARLVSVIFSLSIYLVLIFCDIYNETYSVLMQILSINVVATAFDITFIFQGNEDFGIIALRNVIIKAIGIILIFIFVKDDGDVWVYTLCQSIILILSNLSLWTRLPKYLVRVKFSELNIRRHILPTLRLFIPTIAVSIYTMLDKTLIGLMVPGTTTIDGIEYKIADIENGYYEQSEKLVKMSMMVVTSLGTVMIPRNSQIVASGNIEKFIDNVHKSLKFVMFLGTPIMFGLCAVAQNISPWFFGANYDKVPFLMMLFCPLVLIIGFSNVLGLQYLIPQKRDKEYTIAITFGACINLILNLFLIHFLWSYGACIATLCAELIVTTIMFFYARKDISFLTIFKNSWKYILSGIIMFIIVFISQIFLESSILNSFFLVFLGIFIYFLMLIFLKDETIIEFFTKIKNKISKK